VSFAANDGSHQAGDAIASRDAQVASVMLCLTEKSGRKACAKEVRSSYYRIHRDDPVVAPDAPGIPHAYVHYEGEAKPGTLGNNWDWNVGIDCAPF
jgi:hypothetical protein